MMTAKHSTMAAYVTVLDAFAKSGMKDVGDWVEEVLLQINATGLVLSREIGSVGTIKVFYTKCSIQEIKTGPFNLEKMVQHKESNSLFCHQTLLNLIVSEKEQMMAPLG